MSFILPITLSAAAIAALINFWLGMRIGQVRMRDKVSVGDGGNDQLLRRMRAQANFVEFTPFVLILIAAIELATGTSMWLWAVMTIYMLGRVAHGLGMENDSVLRRIGVMATMLIMVGLAGYALYVAHFTAGQVTEIPADVVPAG
jgi:hypothetical protein